MKVSDGLIDGRKPAAAPAAVSMRMNNSFVQFSCIPVFSPKCKKTRLSISGGGCLAKKAIHT